MQELANRITKNYRHRKRWAKREGLGAWRIYDYDIPGHRYTIDWYEGHAAVLSFPTIHPASKIETPPDDVLQQLVADALSISNERVFIKTRRPKARRQDQYTKLDRRKVSIQVNESGLRFLVNLSDFNDTGLFLDHRLTRDRVRREARQKRFLNLFCYTGSFTVYAAAGGAIATTSIDVSNTYLEWTKKNLSINGRENSRHEFIQADVIRWLEQNTNRRYDLIVLDPPSFSVSKKMAGDLEISRDHPKLIADTMRLLAPGGTLYFSTNYRGFELNPDLLNDALKNNDLQPASLVEELTPSSIPDDFRDKAIHRCFRFVAD